MPDIDMDALEASAEAARGSGRSAEVQLLTTKAVADYYVAASPKTVLALIERVRRAEEALRGLANALEIETGPRGVMDLVPGALEAARAALEQSNG